MRIAGDRIRRLDSGEMSPQFWRDNRCAAPRGIDVKPQQLPGKSAPIQATDRSRRPRSFRGADHHEGRKPVSPILGYSSFQIRHVHLEIAVGGHHAQRFSPESRHVRDLVEAVVGLFCEIDRRRGFEASQPIFAVARKRRGQSDNHRREICLRSAAGKCCSGLRGSPNFAASQPSVCRSISLAAGDVRQFANCGLYMATSVSAMTDASVTLGLKSPK